MAIIIVELHDGSGEPMKLSSDPAKTAAQVLDACTRRFHKGEGTLSPKENPNFALEAEDTVPGGVTYIFIPSAGIQGVKQGASWMPFSVKLFPQHCVSDICTHASTTGVTLPVKHLQATNQTPRFWVSAFLSLCTSARLSMLTLTPQVGMCAYSTLATCFAHVHSNSANHFEQTDAAH